MDYKDFFDRQIRLKNFGEAGQRRLAEAKVAIIGLGGLGCPIALYLAAMGVGELHLIDGDSISKSNLHRQILFGHGDLGTAKVKRAGGFLTHNYPWLVVREWAEELREDNASEIFEGVDIVIDATDTQQSKFLVAALALKHDKILLYGAVEGYEAQITSFFPEMETMGFFELMIKPDESGWVQSCSERGVLGVMPGIAGLEMALEVVRILTGIGENLRGRMLLMDGFSGWRKTLKMGKSNGQERKMALAFLQEKKWEIKQLPSERHRLIDVRTRGEFLQWGKAENIPLANLEPIQGGFDTEEVLVFVCSSGVRSRQACKIFRANGYSKAYYWLVDKTEATLG
jgi:adenylyltransferase/sulfurtransferase